MLLVITKGAGEDPGQGTGSGPDAGAVHEFVENADRYGKVKSCGQTAVILQAAEGRQADHFPFIVADGTAAAAVVDIGIHLDERPAADGFLDRADDAGGQGWLDGGLGGNQIV